MAPKAELTDSRVVAKRGQSDHLRRVEAVLKALANRRRLRMLATETGGAI